VPATADETLADEARRRTKAGAAGIGAGVVTMAAGVAGALVYSDVPAVAMLDALREQLGGTPPAQPLKVTQALYYDAHAAEFVLVAVLLALTAAGMGLTLAYLYRSTKARRPELPRAAIVATIAGAVLVAVGELVLPISVVVQAHALAGSAHPTAAAARDALLPPAGVIGGLMRQLGVFGLGAGFIMITFNAMRVGLLTRFMGVLGIIVGGLTIVPLGASLPIVQAFWLAAVGALFLGHWPPGLPPAWVTGEPQPWPTQQEIREQRMALREERSGKSPEPPAPKERPEPPAPKERPEQPAPKERPEPPEPPAPLAPDRPAHPSSKKRKRRRH
jgi:hypothetical protein